MSVDAPIVLKDSKSLVRPKPILRSINSTRSCWSDRAPPLDRDTPGLAATELLRRGSLLGDIHESSVAADGHSIFDS